MRVFSHSVGGFNNLLRELVAEFTLTDSSTTTAVCLAGLLGQKEESVVLNSWCRASDQQLLEDAVSLLLFFSLPFPLARAMVFWPNARMQLPLIKIRPISGPSNELLSSRDLIDNHHLLLFLD